MCRTRQRDRLIASLPPFADLIRGSLVRYYHEGCRCHPNGRYGPYWYLSVNQGGGPKCGSSTRIKSPRSGGPSRTTSAGGKPACASSNSTPE